LFCQPRPPTISPWSSKATDIAHTCGLKSMVDRIERGIVYLIIHQTHELSNEEINSISHLLYDRMTQILVKKTCQVSSHVKEVGVVRSVPLLEAVQQGKLSLSFFFVVFILFFC